MRILAFLLLGIVSVAPSSGCAQQSERLNQPQSSERSITIDVEPEIPNELIMRGDSFDDFQGRFLTREQLAEIRDHFIVAGPRMIISSIEADGCIAAGQVFTINGTGFGASQGSNSVWLSRRGVDLWEAMIVSWSDTEIVARSLDFDMSGRFNVGVKDASGRYKSNRTKSIDVCLFEVGGVRTESGPGVAALAVSCFDIDRVEIDVVCDDTCKLVDRGRVVHDWLHFFEDAASGSVISKPYKALFFILEREVDEQCIGPVRAPVFDEDGTLIREYDPVVFWRSAGTSVSGAGGRAAYDVDCRLLNSTGRVDYSNLEIRLAPDGFWAVGSDYFVAGRLFGFTVLNRWSNRSDAITGLRLHEEELLRQSCRQRDLITDPWRTFEFWSR